MTSQTDDSAAVHGFKLRCTDCTFETTVDGSSVDALDAATAHQDEHGDDPSDHFVNFERTERD